MEINNDLRSLAKSFSCAFRGFANCVISERNMRIHLVVATYVIFFSTFYDFSRTDYSIISVAIALVLICEMFNTAIEAIVDKISPNYTTLAKIAKDIAAGAVFVASIFAAVIGVLLFWDWDIIVYIYLFFIGNPVYIILLLITLLLSLVFIFKGLKYVRPTDRIILKKKRG